MDEKTCESSGIPEWMKRALECPVCLETIIDPPIFICENSHGHSVCFTCHESIQKKDKMCPICRNKMNKKRNMAMESMVDSLPIKKVKCKYDGCCFKKTTIEAVKRHEEEECLYRYIPCAHCDDNKIPLKRLADHLTQTHKAHVPLDTKFRVATSIWSTFGANPNRLTTFVLKIKGNGESPTFVCNWCALDEITLLFWTAYIGPKDSAANYTYTLQIEGNRESRKKKFCYECTRFCIPCDLSHQEVKDKRCAVMVERDLIEKAKMQSQGKLRLHYSLTIENV